jgi:arsenite methyltransferase
MSGLEFSEETARQLERILRTRDVVAQRSETIKQLALSPGERVLELVAVRVFCAKAWLRL